MWRFGYRALALWIAFGAMVAQARGTGGLRVNVIDAHDDPVSRVTVILRHDAGRLAPQIRLTDVRGIAEFPVLPADGEWTVRVVSGDGREYVRGVVVVLGRLTPVVVRVTTDPALESTPSGAPHVEETASITRFPEAFVRELPVLGRFYPRVFALAPGVNDADHDGNPRVHGSSSRDFRALVNGVADADPLSQRFTSVTPSESIEQIAVIPTGAGLQYGRAQGGFATIAQKIGGNRYSVGAELRFRSSILDGSGDAADGSGEVEFRSLQPSIHVSGPVVKDRAWFRLAWEQIDGESPVDLLHGLALQTRDDTREAHQLTWQASSRHRLALQYQSDPLRIRGFGIDSSVPRESSQRVDIDSDALSLVWTVPWSSRLRVESTAAVTDRSTRLAPDRSGSVNDCVTGVPFLEQSLCTRDTNGDSGSFFRDVEADADRWALASHATWHLGRFGSVTHLVRLGFEFEGEQVARTTTRNTRSALFVQDSPHTKFSPEPIYLLASSVPLASPNLDSVDAAHWAVYAEESLRPSGGLVIEVGLRLDREEIDLEGSSPFDPEAELAAYLRDQENGPPGDVDHFTDYEGRDTLADDLASQTGIPASFWLPECSICPPRADPESLRTPTDIAIRNTNLGPRIAISWDPWNDGRNKFVASARRYYGSLLSSVPLLEAEAPTTSVAFSAEQRDDSLVVDGRSPGFGLGIDTTVTDHALETPYQDEWRLVYERELRAENRLHVEYVNREYRDQLQLDEINRNPGDFGRCRVADLDDWSPLASSPGSGFELTDPFTGEVYVDRDPGNGDGRLDDCVGSEVLLEYPDDTGSLYVERPDGTADAYVQNPYWNSVTKVTNQGRRDYEAFVVEFVRRPFRGWAMQASYVWSRFEGSGEPVDPYVGPGRLLENVWGAESNDRRHVFKVASSGRIRDDWHLGGVVSWQSGLPYSSVRFELDDPPVPPGLGSVGTIGKRPGTRMHYRTDERNTERNDARWSLDCRVAKGFAVGDRSRLELALDVFNLFDDRTREIYNPDTGIGLQVNGVVGGRRDFGRRFQLGLRFAY